MTSQLQTHASLLIRKLETITDLSDEERQALNELPVTVRNLKTDQDIVRDQDRPSQCCLILTGFACRYKMTAAGKRQIFSFHIPGDIPDMQSIHLSVMDHSLGTLTASKVAFIPHEHVRALNLPAHRRHILARHADRRGGVPGMAGGCRTAHLL